VAFGPYKSDWLSLSLSQGLKEGEVMLPEDTTTTTPLIQEPLVQELRQRLDLAEAQRADLEIMLDTIVEHSTTLEQEIYLQNEALGKAEQEVRQLNAILEERVKQRTAELEAVHRRLHQASLVTIERTYEAVHNGPLQTLAVLLRSDIGAMGPEALRSQLLKINQDLRGIYQSMRQAAGNQDEPLYLESDLILDLNRPMDEMLTQIFDHTLEREYPGFAQIAFEITPDFSALASAGLVKEHKRGICLFFQEALLNIGKHAYGTTEIKVVCQQVSGTYRLAIVDNGVGEEVKVAIASDHQGTHQAEQLAQQLGGTFQRRANAPRGTHCELSWPQRER
jgi:nitrate/nitrite-specific signal transduction histidine kinase